MAKKKTIPLSVNKLVEKLEHVKLVELNGKVVKESMGCKKSIIPEFKGLYWK
ncbi:MAG: hypothetical protein N2V78_08375 [Methanophagales archaeon]|nr:hypothetical protein [Methanophagales archaeon]MCW3140957.1 hypothetical protein [Methanophagales archaeon]